MTSAGFLDTVTRRFAADEMLVRADRTTGVNVAAVGTLATLSLGSPLLDAAWRAAGSASVTAPPARTWTAC